jgi:hypothetical protein
LASSLDLISLGILGDPPSDVRTLAFITDA